MSNWAIKSAVYSVLANASPSIADGRIFSPVAENYNPPNAGDIWISLDWSDSVSDDVESSTGFDTRLLVHVWQRSNSYKALDETVEQIRSELHDRALTASGWEYARSRVRSIQSLRDPDGLHLHYIVEVIINHFT